MTLCFLSLSSGFKAKTQNMTKTNKKLRLITIDPGISQLNDWI